MGLGDGAGSSGVGLGGVGGGRAGPDPVEYVPAVQRVQSTAAAGKVLSADDYSRHSS
jgi:hypothetical protein